MIMINLWITMLDGIWQPLDEQLFFDHPEQLKQLEEPNRRSAMCLHQFNNILQRRKRRHQFNQPVVDMGKSLHKEELKWLLGTELLFHEQSDTQILALGNFQIKQILLHQRLTTSKGPYFPIRFFFFLAQVFLWGNHTIWPWRKVFSNNVFENTFRCYR